MYGVSYQPSPGSGQVAANGQCGKVKDGTYRTDYQECYPVFYPPEVTQASYHPGTNKWKEIFQDRTQVGPNYQSCNYGATRYFESSCATKQCSSGGGGEGCPENSGCDFDPSSYASPDPRLYPDSPHCPIGWVLSWCYVGYCCLNPGSPILIDMGGDGFDLTDAAGGVLFDILATGEKRQVSWTAPNSNDAWLVLDRNGNGTIDSGVELFGNKTPQPPGPRPQGFLALAEYDKAEFGGIGDGVITDADGIWPSLRLWRDINHNGRSEPAELSVLSSAGIEGLGLQYHESRRKDAQGNTFKYRARIYASKDSTVGKWAFDVFLVHAAP